MPLHYDKLTAQGEDVLHYKNSNIVHNISIEQSCTLICNNGLTYPEILKLQLDHISASLAARCSTVMINLSLTLFVCGLVQGWYHIVGISKLNLLRTVACCHWDGESRICWLENENNQLEDTLKLHRTEGNYRVNFHFTYSHLVSCLYEKH